MEKQTFILAGGQKHKVDSEEGQPLPEVLRYGELSQESSTVS